MEDSASVRSAARFDIDDENAKGGEGIDVKERKIQMAGETRVVAREFSKRVDSRGLVEDRRVR